MFYAGISQTHHSQMDGKYVYFSLVRHIFNVRYLIIQIYQNIYRNIQSYVYKK